MAKLTKFSSEDQVENVLTQIENILSFLPGPLTAQKLVGLDEDAVGESAQSVYSVFLDRFFKICDQNFPFKNNKLHGSVKKMFEVEDARCFKSNVENLIRNLNHQKTSNTALLQICFQSEGLLSYMFNNCYNNYIERDEEDLKTFITLLTSIPNRIANVCQRDTPDFFVPSNFCKFLLFKILTTLELIVQFITQDSLIEPHINLEVVSILLSKTLLNFNEGLNNDGIKTFIEIFGYLTNKNSAQLKFYQRIFQRVIINLERSAADIIAKMIMLNIDAHKYFVKFILGQKLMKNETWRFILCTKIPLLTYFIENCDNLILNLTVYVSAVDSQLLVTLYINLLSVWADRNSVNHTSVEQQIFITKFIIIITNLLNNIGLTDFEAQIVKEKVLSGIQVHLECPVETLRVCGMKVGEIVLNFINKEGMGQEESELKFSYEKFSEESQIMIKELQLMSRQDLNEYFLQRTDIKTDLQLLLGQLHYQNGKTVEYIPPNRKFRNKSALKQFKNELEYSELKKVSNIRIIDGTDFQLDSDDDLEPYDISNDIKITKKSPPAYLRDLRDGLLETEDAEMFTMCLENCKKLVVSQLPDDDASLGIELLEILIALDERFYTENFDEYLFQSCVCITCVYPTIYAEYLCKQIHADVGTYSIARRIFMLDIIKQSSRNLSTIKKEIIDNQTKRQEEIHLAEEIIRKRLESKTRYFTKHKPQKYESINHFAQVAGHFFFPLLFGYNTNKILRDDKDFILLIHFVETLAIIMCAAQNCPISSKMAKEVFQFSWFLRFHVDVKVKMAILSLIASAILSVHKDILISEFLNELFEIRLWLADLLNPNIPPGEPNMECRNLAASVMILIESIFKMDVDNT